ncbi:MAG: hypothetical protein JW774_10700 [Candidatus Aureabacteria bacterium]|nr:hypothetical protein [Candidatus Auribacterota bacterium]
MKKWTNKAGVALILTISVLTAMCIMGITVLSQLLRDQRISRLKTDSWSAVGAVQVSVKAGCSEIREQLSNEWRFFESIVQTYDEDFPVYCKNVIRATNGKLNLSARGPEFFQTFIHLFDLNSAMTFSKMCMVYHTGYVLNLYSSDWTLNSPNELIKIKGTAASKCMGMDTFSAFSMYDAAARIYQCYRDEFTVFPKEKNELLVNIIDYGSCSSATLNTFTALNRDFHPLYDSTLDPEVNSANDPLRGARITIISGPGAGQENVIDHVDTSTTSRLVLKNNWSIVPNNFSTYRIFSYVTPINFNAASKGLILANFRVMQMARAKLNQFNSLHVLKTDDPGGTSIERQLEIDRPINGPRLRLYSHFKDLRDYFLSPAMDGSIEGMDLIEKWMDPKQPKGILNASSIREIYPLPVPFCYSSNGYFDMIIDTGLKRNTKLNSSITNMKRTYTTIQNGGRTEQSLREQFESEGGTLAIQHWVTTSDWVPVRNMSDFTNWQQVYTNAFQAYWSAEPPYSATPTIESPNVIPDSVKNGLWFDFGAADASQGRGDDLIYSQLTGQLEHQYNLYAMQNNPVFFKLLLGQSQLNLISSSMEIYGNLDPTTLPTTPPPDSPGCEIILGSNDAATTDAYEFGDVCVMTKIKDISNVFSGSTRIDHPPDNASWYSYQGGRIYSNHEWGDHTNTGSDKTYPPKRYFSPALVFRNNIGGTGGNPNLVFFRPEWGYQASYDPLHPTCLLSASYDYVISGNFPSFSVTIGDDSNPASFISSASNPPTQYYDHYKLMSGIIAVSTSNEQIRLRTNPDDLTAASFTTISGGGTLNSINGVNPVGKIGFKRLFPTGFYSGINNGTGSNDGKFSLEYLRVIPGIKHISDSYYMPAYTSPQHMAPHVKKYSLCRIHYQVGLNKTPIATPPYPNTEYNIRFQFALDLWSSDPNAANPQISLTQPDTAITINDATDLQTKISSSVDFVLPDNTASNNHKYKYRISYIYPLNSYPPSTEDRKNEYFAFLRTTIAITKVEIFYETEDRVVSYSDHL